MPWKVRDLADDTSIREKKACVLLKCDSNKQETCIVILLFYPSIFLNDQLRSYHKLIKGCFSQFSRSEVVLTFFERSPLDQVLRNDNVHKIQPCFQSPVKISGRLLMIKCWLISLNITISTLYNINSIVNIIIIMLFIFINNRN